MSMSICRMYVCVCMYVYIYIYKHVYTNILRAVLTAKLLNAPRQLDILCCPTSHLIILRRSNPCGCFPCSSIHASTVHATDHCQTAERLKQFAQRPLHNASPLVCMYVCMHACMDGGMNGWTGVACACTHAYRGGWICACMHAWIRACAKYVCVHLCMYVRKCVCACKHACMYVCVCASLCTCIYV